MFTRTFPRFRQYVAALVVSISVLSIGSGAGWTGNSIDVLLAGGYNNIHIDPAFLGWIISLPNLAAMIFSLHSGIICDRFGRKITLLFFTIPLITGWFLILFANTVDYILIGRFALGIGNGSLYFLASLYASEIAEKEIRAKLGSFVQLFLFVGIFLSYVLTYILDIRICTFICTVIPILFFVAFLFQVESPIYEINKGNFEEGKAILRYLRGPLYDVDSEVEEIKIRLEMKKAKVPIKESLKKRSTKVAVIVGLSLVFFQQACGSIVVILYAIEIFFSSGSTLAPKKATIIVGGLRVLASLGSSTIIDMFPRRLLLLISNLLSAVGLIILASYYTLKDRSLASEEILSNLGFMPVMGLSIFTLSVSIGISPMPATITAELLPMEIKGIGVSVIGGFSWLFLFIISKFYPNLKSVVGGDGTFYIFAGVCMLSALFALFVVPETKGKSLEKIQSELNNKGTSSA